MFSEALYNFMATNKSQEDIENIISTFAIHTGEIGSMSHKTSFRLSTKEDKSFKMSNKGGLGIEKIDIMGEMMSKIDKELFTK